MKLLLISLLPMAIAAEQKKQKTILVTGGHGLVGSAVQEIAKQYPEHNWIFARQKEADLTSQEQTMRLFATYQPTHVVHLAANVGGLFKNMNRQAEMYSDNLLMGWNVLHAAHVNQIQKTISCLSTCVFPADVTYPITEEMLHQGPPHSSNYGYAYAKRTLEIQSRAYREQYGSRFTCIIPTNIFGPNDNFNLQDGHVIPALIHKCHNSMKNGEKFVVCGSGRPLRQFIYSQDIARIILKILDSSKEIDNVILTTPEEISIGDVARMVALKMGFKGEIVFDESKADGQMRKPASNARLSSLFPDMQYEPFEKALEETVKWFLENHSTARL